jgi:hypothetical protein
MIRVINTVTADFKDCRCSFLVPLGSRLLAVDFDLANISVLLQSPYAENKAERLTFHLFEVGDKIFDAEWKYVSSNGDFALYQWSNHE